MINTFCFIIINLYQSLNLQSNIIRIEYSCLMLGIYMFYTWHDVTKHSTGTIKYSWWWWNCNYLVIVTKYSLYQYRNAIGSILSKYRSWINTLTNRHNTEDIFIVLSCTSKNTVNNSLCFDNNQQLNKF